MKSIWIGVLAFSSMTVLAMAGQELGVGGSYVTTDGGNMAGILVKYAYGFSDYFGLELRASYLSGTDAKADTISGSGYTINNMYGAEGSQATVVPLEAAIKIAYPVKPVVPYILLGGGYYLYTIDLPLEANPGGVVGYFAAGGIEFDLGNDVGLFVEAKYIQATWETEETCGLGTMTIEGGINGIGATAGIVWKF